MNCSNERKNTNNIKNELYGINLMLVYCVYHSECYIRQCSIEDCEKYEVPLKYEAPHAKHLGVCDETDLYNMGIFNFNENEDTNKVQITILQDVRIDYGKFGNLTRFNDFYNEYIDTITDEIGNEVYYKNNNLAQWFNSIEVHKLDDEVFLREGEIFYNY